MGCVAAIPCDWGNKPEKEENLTKMRKEIMQAEHLHILRITIDHLDNGEGDGALLLVLQQLLKDEFEQEGKGEDNPVPGTRG